MEKNKLYNPDKVNSLEMQFGDIVKGIKVKSDYYLRIKIKQNAKKTKTK